MRQTHADEIEEIRFAGNDGPGKSNQRCRRHQHDQEKHSQKGANSSNRRSDHVRAAPRNSSSLRGSFSYMPPKPPLERMATTSPLCSSCEIDSTIPSASANSRACLPFFLIPLMTDDVVRRSFSGTASGLKMLVMMISSAIERLAIRSFCRTLRRRVLERGSKMAHSRAEGYRVRSAFSVAAMAVG